MLQNESYVIRMFFFRFDNILMCHLNKLLRRHLKTFSKQNLYKLEMWQTRLWVQMTLLDTRIVRNDIKMLFFIHYLFWFEWNCTLFEYLTWWISLFHWIDSTINLLKKLSIDSWSWLHSFLYNLHTIFNHLSISWQTRSILLRTKKKAQ